MYRRPPGERVIEVVPHARLEIVPLAPVVDLAPADEKPVVPKFASGRVRQFVALVQSEGASTIHSAEPTSIEPAPNDLVKAVWRVRSASFSWTRWPTTVTEADSRSPGRTRRLTDSDGAGTSSYQAEESTRPDRLQSTSVPICSSEFELWL